MKSLVIAEKPSVARDIARVLHCTQKGNGTLEDVYKRQCMASPMAWVLAGGLLIVMYFYVMKDMKRRLGL